MFMVASTKIQSLSDRAEEISILREFLTNPNLCADLAAEVKKLNSLSADEESRHQEAKILIQQRDKLVVEVAGFQTRIDAERSVHEEHLSNTKATYEKWFDNENKKIADANAALDARKAEQEIEDTRLRQKANKLKETAAQMQGLTVSVE